MSKQEIKKRIEKLKKEINHHRYLYHVLDKQEISDAALDSLKHELAELEQDNPELITPDSPTQRVSGKALDKFDKVSHQQRMLSLNDAFSFDEIKDWEVRNKKLLSAKEKLDFYVELKMDGLALSLIYVDGILKKGATRGDGAVGEDVTNNIRTIEAIPLKINLDSIKKAPQMIEVRGEVFMEKNVFDTLNMEQEKKGAPKFANPRNAAAGSIRQLNPNIMASRKLNFMAYDLVSDLGQETHEQSHKVLEKLGFRAGHQHNKYCHDIEEVQRHFEMIGKIREKFDYWTDGLVVNVNNLATFRKLGIVGKAPRGAIAYKYPAEQATTVVEDIQVQVGRTGALTPVAHLRPVQVAGSTVSRATLHNIDEISRLDVRIGDTVIVQKAGDIIPDIVSVLTKLRTGQEKKFKMPAKCPVCGAKVNRKEGEVAYYCDNNDCFAQQHSAMQHFISKKAFDIEGLGPKVLEQLFRADLIKSPADLFALTKEDLQPLERFAEKSADNLIQAIQESKKITLPRFIYALGIRHVGEETAIDLANEFGSMEKLMKASAEELENIEDIGGVVAESIEDYFSRDKNKSLIKKLLEIVVIEKMPARQKNKTKLSGKKIVVTGVLDNFSREEVKSKIRQAGGKWVSSVSKKTDYMVVGDNPGSKAEKAKQLGVRILTEAEFIKLIK